MRERDAGRQLSRDAYLQDTFAVDRGDVIWFTLQLEVFDEGEWRPVLRCDTAHNEAHLDYINPQGETYRKQWLQATGPYNSTHTQMAEEIEATYQAHINRWYSQKGK